MGNVRFYIKETITGIEIAVLHFCMSVVSVLWQWIIIIISSSSSNSSSSSRRNSFLFILKQNI
jgi:hypothetical protein